MKKVKLKLSIRDMESLIQMLEMVLQNQSIFYYSDDMQDKLIVYLLGELYEKMRAKFSPFKREYKLTISPAHATALLIHALLPIGTLPVGSEIEINTIISNIDKQTR